MSKLNFITAVCFVLTLFPVSAFADNYLCTIDRMGRIYEGRVSDERPAPHLKSFGFQIKYGQLIFSEKGWFVSDVMSISQKTERGGKLVGFTAVNSENIVKFKDQKLSASTILTNSIMSFIADCEKF